MGKNIDTELAEAAGVDKPGTSADTFVEASPALVDPLSPPSTQGRSSAPLLVMLLVMVAGIVCLFMFGFKEAAVYSMPMQELVAEPDKHAGRRVRIEGELVAGTLVKRDEPCEYRFRIRGGDKELAIHYPQCIIPDGFRERGQQGVDVTAEGELHPDGHFVATMLLAKCSSKYDPETHSYDDNS